MEWKEGVYCELFLIWLTYLNVITYYTYNCFVPKKKTQTLLRGVRPIDGGVTTTRAGQNGKYFMRALKMKFHFFKIILYIQTVCFHKWYLPNKIIFNFHFKNWPRKIWILSISLTKMNGNVRLSKYVYIVYATLIDYQNFDRYYFWWVLLLKCKVLHYHFKLL